jgi:uncharacterized membrane protein YciS (DUF1049 family)
MQPTFHMSGGSGAETVKLLAVLGVLWGLAVTIFWMVCAWRAMRAHEKLAEAVERISRKQP